MAYSMEFRHRRTRREHSELDTIFDDGSPASLWTCRLMAAGGALEPEYWSELAPGSDELCFDDDGESDAERRGRREEMVARRLARFRARLEQLEAAPLDESLPEFVNVRHVALRLGLRDIERAVLAFAVCLGLRGNLSDAFDRALSLNGGKLYATIALALACTPEEARAALHHDSPIVAAGIVSADRCFDPSSEQRITVNASFSHALRREYIASEEMFAHFFTPGTATQLGLDDFPHVRDGARLALRLLAAATRERAPGTNVLIHGHPGVGKTDLARVIAREIGASLFEVASQDEEGEGLPSSGRLTAYALSQRILASSQGAIVLFDEIDAALSGGRRRRWSRSPFGDPELGLDKAWMNRTLEKNPVPAIWVANHGESIDPSLLRRFRFILEVREPPPAVRKVMIRRYLGSLEVSDAWLTRVARDSRVAPGHIENAAAAVRLSGVETTAEVESTMSRVIDGCVDLQGPSRMRPAVPLDLGEWSSQWVNSSIPLPPILEGLTRESSGTVLLYGPPGTGKSAFAHQVAATVGRELVAKRASDLLSMWVGQNERLIAEMFAEARAANAVLLLDEADSFLGDRSGAHQSWEVSKVNEMLVQMEAFQGIFLCSTNLVETLDPAVFRRFALKIRFDPMHSNQRWGLFCRTLEAFGIGPDEALRSAIDRLSLLTPGDFAAVVRKARLLGAPKDAAALVESLREEQRMNPKGRAKEIGFGSQVAPGAR